MNRPAMTRITLTNRDLTPWELTRIRVGFDELTVAKDVAMQSADRFGFVATEGDRFVGCSSGLAYKNGETYSGWFYTTDLFVKGNYRKQGLGARLLQSLEEEISRAGVRHIWTWTAGYEAPEFYLRQGYTDFARLEGWYSDGSSRLPLRKTLT